MRSCMMSSYSPSIFSLSHKTKNNNIVSDYHLKIIPLIISTSFTNKSTRARLIRLVYTSPPRSALPRSTADPTVAPKKRPRKPNHRKRPSTATLFANPLALGSNAPLRVFSATRARRGYLLYSPEMLWCNLLFSPASDFFIFFDMACRAKF